MGKFSKPRNSQWNGREEETQVIPKVTPSPRTHPDEPMQNESFGDSFPDITKTQTPVAKRPAVPEPEDDFDDEMEQEAPRKRGKIALISVCAVAAVALIAAVVLVGFLLGKDPNDGKILNNVFVAGINIGNMTKEEAETALHRVTDLTYTMEDMVVEMPDATLTFSPANTGAKLDVPAIVQAAYDYGRVGTRAEKQEAKKNSLKTEHPIALLPYLSLNTDYIRTQLEAYGAEFNSDFAQSSATVEGAKPILDASDENFDLNAPCQTLVVFTGKPGRYVDINQVYNQVLDAYSFNRFLVKAEMNEGETLPARVDLQSLYETYYCAPVNAVIDSKNASVTREIYGYDFDLQEAMSLMDSARYGETVRIPFRMVTPELSGNLLFRDVLGAYQTKHTNDAKRNTNLKLACEAVNGFIIGPGEVFDFNKVVGKRTAEKGYQAAAAYDSGKTVQSLGGGICQVSSTIYYCVLLADLETLQRSPHSYVSSYMPAGTDATVSWGGPEFSFKNNFNFPIRIDAEVSDGYVKVQLMGTDEKDYYIEIESEIVSRSSYKKVYEEYAPGNPEGYKDGDTIQTPYAGCTAKTYKLKYDKITKKLISKEFDQTSVYKSRDMIIAKVVEATTPTDPEPTPPPSSGGESGGGESGGGSGETGGSGSSGGESGGSSSGGESGGSSSGGESGGSGSSSGESGGGSSGGESGGGSSGGESGGGESGGGSSGGESGGGGSSGDE